MGAGVVVDGGYYPSNLRIPGIEDDDEAYDALNSALAVNFNTIYAVRSGAKVRSAEDQTPITPLAIALFRANPVLGNPLAELLGIEPLDFPHQRLQVDHDAIPRLGS